MQNTKSVMDISGAMITFLHETKEGKYAVVNTDVIEVPRNTISRDEYVFDDEMPMFYSMSN